MFAASTSLVLFVSGCVLCRVVAEWRFVDLALARICEIPDERHFDAGYSIVVRTRIRDSLRVARKLDHSHYPRDSQRAFAHRTGRLHVTGRGRKQTVPLASHWPAAAVT